MLTETNHGQDKPDFYFILGREQVEGKLSILSIRAAIQTEIPGRSTLDDLLISLIYNKTEPFPQREAMITQITEKARHEILMTRINMSNQFQKELNLLGFKDYDMILQSAREFLGSTYLETKAALGDNIGTGSDSIEFLFMIREPDNKYPHYIRSITATLENDQIASGEENMPTSIQFTYNNLPLPSKVQMMLRVVEKESQRFESYARAYKIVEKSGKVEIKIKKNHNR